MTMAENEDVREIHQRGLYFEELDAGALYVHSPGRTMTEADNVLFTTLSMNTQALHLDAAFAATQPFGRRVMNSMFTLATMVGQSVSQLTQGTLLGQLGLTDVRFPHPLFPGIRSTPRPASRTCAPPAPNRGSGWRRLSTWVRTRTE